MSANILFFSNACQGSQALLSLMQGENLTKFFHLICTDNNSKIPPQIKVTPTLIIKGIDTPYVAGDAFVWFSKIKQWKIQMMMQKMSNMQKQYLQANNNLVGTPSTEFWGFSKNEMEGMSDIFAFITENNIPHAHLEYNKIGTEDIFYVADEDEDKRKINESQLKQMQKTLEAERNKQDNLVKQQLDDFVKQTGQKKRY
jgi:hypothetical protein